MHSFLGDNWCLVWLNILGDIESVRAGTVMGMYGELCDRGFELVSDTSIADWASRRQSGDLYRVDFQVPAGFGKFCRVLHRVHGPSDGGPSDSFLPWSDYAQSVGLSIRPDTRWDEISRRDPRLRSISPDVGQLDQVSAPAYLRFLAGHMPAEAPIFAGYWDGIQPLHIPGASFPTARLGLRDYVLFKVTLAVLTDAFHAESGPLFDFPALLWPEDRSWYLSTEVDYNSTLVGGSEEFVDALLAHKSIEALPIGPDVDLTYRAAP